MLAGQVDDAGGEHAGVLAPSTATQATGTPGGIWATDSNASSPPRTCRRGWHADHRKLGVGGGDSGQVADMPAPAMITLRPRIFALAVLATSTWGRDGPT